MSMELTIGTEMGKSLEELMGIANMGGSTESKQPSLARVGMIHQAVMGDVDVGGKTLRTEVLPIGTYQVEIGDEKVYSAKVSIRVFATRQRWQRWNNATEEMEKTVMSTSLSKDLKDNLGGYNIGRPSGYIEDFNALPDATKDHMRSVKKVKVFMGLITIDNPMDETGNPVDIKVEDVPFVMDIKNRDSLKSLDTAMGRRSPIEMLTQEFNLTSDVGSIPSGAQFGVVKAVPGSKVDIQDTDNETLKNFLEYIDYSNATILEKYNDRCEDNAIEGEVF